MEKLDIFWIFFPVFLVGFVSDEIYFGYNCFGSVRKKKERTLVMVTDEIFSKMNQSSKIQRVQV